jgi:twinkle protein
MRGSASLEQLSDNIIAVERDQQGDNPDQSRIRLLKNREFGDLGEADLNEFNLITGRLLPVSESLIKPSGFTDFDPDDVPF